LHTARVPENSPFIRNDLPEAIEHASVVILARHWNAALDLSAQGVTILPKPSRRLIGTLHSGLDHVQRVHDQNLRDTGHSTRDELVYEGERLGFAGHGGLVRVGGWSRWESVEAGRLTFGKQGSLCASVYCSERLV